MHENIIHGSFHDPYEQHDYQDFFALSMEKCFDCFSWTLTPMMSPLCARMNKKKEVVLNSVAEFLGIWALRGEASLSLKTKDGVTTIAFTHSLSGHPEDPLHPPPAPVGTSRQRRRRRRRGPARRERDRQQAACHQAAQAGAPPASPPSAASPAAPF